MAAAPGVSQGTGCIEVRIHIGQDDEAFFGQDFRGFDGFVVVRQEIFGVAHDFDLDEVATADFTGQVGDADGFVCRAGARRVREQGDVFRDIIEDVIFLTGFDAAQGHGYDLGTALFDSGLDEVDRKLTGT